MKKTVVGLMLILICVTINNISVFAYDPGMEGNQYSICTNVRNKTIDWKHVAENGTNEVDHVSYVVSRTKSFTGNLSGTVEAEMLTTTIKVTAEVGYGSEKTESTTLNYSIPENSTVTCVYGSRRVKTTGYLEKWRRGKKVSSKYAYGDWSYCSYSSKNYN